MRHVQNMSSRKFPGYNGEKKYPDLLVNFSLKAEIKKKKSCKFVIIDRI